MGSDDEYMKALEIQRRNFEAQFGSLETLGYEDKTLQAPGGSEDEDEGDEDEFNGFGSESELDSSSSEESEEEYHEKVETKVVPKVIKLGEFSTGPPTNVSKADRKLLRQGRAPTLAEIEKKQRDISRITEKQNQQALKEDNDNLENDLKLQRLLSESHILANQVEYSGADVTLQTLDYEDPTGKARRRALDSRIRTISATNSATGGKPKKLESMPMSIRKGMVRSRQEKIAKYEQEAKDAGIVLSKVKAGELRDLDAGKGSTSSSIRIGTGKKIEKRVRDRGLKINAVGRSTRNGLVIAQADIDRINGAGRGGRGGKGRRGGKRR